MEEWVAIQIFSLNFLKSVPSIYNQNSLWGTRLENDCIIYLKTTHLLTMFFFNWKKKIREIREINSCYTIKHSISGVQTAQTNMLKLPSQMHKRISEHNSPELIFDYLLSWTDIAAGLLYRLIWNFLFIQDFTWI